MEESSSSTVSCWRRPHGSQKKTREHLIQLLPLCGHKGALKASHSVTFSSSSDLAVESKQTASSGEASGDEQADIDDTGFSGRQLHNVFTEFDFLDDELDKESDDMNSFGWASTTELGKGESLENLRSMPSPSRSGSEEELRENKDEEISDEEESEYGTSLTSSVLHSLKESMVDEYDDESDHEETQTPIAIDVREDQNVTDKPELSPASLGSNDSTLDGVEEQDQESINDAIQVGQNDSPNRRSELLSASPVHALTITPMEEIPSIWSLFVTAFLSSPTILSAVESFPYFPLVLKASSSWLQSLTQDCCEQFHPHLKLIYDKYTAVRQTIDDHLQIPFIFIDKETFEKANLLAKHKFMTLKLNECIQVLQEKREKAIEQLQSLQRHKDLASEREDSCDFQFFPAANEDEGSNRKLLQKLFSLCFYLHRLHVQFILCLEIYQNYVTKVMKSTRQLEATDLSNELSECLAKVDVSRELQQDTEYAVHSSMKTNGDDFERKNDIELIYLENESECSQGLGHESDSEIAQQELIEHGMPRVGHSPTGEVPRDFMYVLEEEAEGIDSVPQDHAANAENVDEETAEALNLDISNEDIRTAQIINTQEDVCSVTVSGKLGCEDANGNDVSGNDLHMLKESLGDVHDLNNSQSTSLTDQQRDITKVEGDIVDPSQSENPERNISVSELRSSSSSLTCEKTPAIETILENVIISSSFREDSNERVSRKKVKAKNGKKGNMEINHTDFQNDPQSWEYKHNGDENEQYKEDEEKRDKEGDTRKEQNSHELEEKNAKLETVVEVVGDLNFEDFVNPPKDKNETPIDPPSKAVAVEEKQHEVRIADSYRLIEIASTLMANDNGSWTEKRACHGSDGEIQTVEILLTNISNSIEDGEFSDIVRFLREYRREQLARDIFIDDNERDILMILFAKHLMKNKPSSVFALTSSLESLADVCDELSECMTELLSLINSEKEKRNK